MRKLTLLLSLALMLGFIVSCKKKSDPTPVSTVNQHLLKTWKASKVLENTLDITSAFSAYRITFEETNGEKKFTLVDRQGTTSAGTWTMATDETSITLTYASGSAQTLSTVSTGESELKYTSKEQGKAGDVSLVFTLIPA